MPGPTFAGINQIGINAAGSVYTSSPNHGTEEIEYPRINIMHRFLSKPWRSNYRSFVISTLNQKMDFNIGAGNLVTTIPAGTYRGSELAAQMASGLNSTAGTTDITCIYLADAFIFDRVGQTLHLLPRTGTNFRTSIYPTIGIDCRTDPTGPHVASFGSVVATSGGNITITTSNNKLYFNIGAGGLTATIASGTYSCGALCSEIKYQMQLASSGVTDWFPVYDGVSHQFRLYKGSGTFNLTCSNTTTAIWDDIGFAHVDRSGSLGYTADYIRIGQNEAVVFYFPTAIQLRFFAIAGINIKTAGSGTTMTIRLQANTSDSWSSPAISLTPTEQLIDDSKGQGWAYWDTGGWTYQFWRLVITNADNSDGYIQVGVIYMGAKSALSINYNRSAVHTKFTSTEKQITDAGAVYGEAKGSWKEFTFTWNATIKQTDKNTLDALLDVVEDIEPFAILLDSTGLIEPKFMWAIFVSRPQFTETTPDSGGGARWSTSITIREAA